MNDDARIRWLASAALALTGACGDDGATPERDASQSDVMTGAPEAGATTDAEPDSEAEADAGAGDGSALVDDERVAQAALAFCVFTFECDAKMSAMYLESAEECPEIVEAFVRDGAALDGAACGNAQLDSYECYTSAGCDEQFTACEQEAERESAACPLSLGDI